MTRLLPMTPGEFPAFMDRLVREYAADHVRGGRWTEKESLGEARRETDRLLPKGVETPNHYLFSIHDDAGGAPIGAIWLGPSESPQRGFVFDLWIAEPFRRKGHARAAMLALERLARDRGFDSLGLHVFAHNAGAIRLYEELGYHPTNIVMAKPLPP